MNLFEKIRFNIIQRLIDKKSFESAIKNIDRLIPHTTRLRKCINLKVKCLIEQNKYQEASDLCQYLFPYAVKDIDDIDTLSHLSKIYYHLGNQIQANKYLNSYKILTSTQEERKLFLDQYNKKSYNIYNDFISTNNISKVILDNIIDDNLQMLRITEASVYFSLAKRLGINISNNNINEFMKYEQAVNFSNELNVNQNNVYCVISESSDEDELLRDQCLVKALSVLGTKVYHIIPFYESYQVDYSINDYLKMSESDGNIFRIKTIKIKEKSDVNNISEIINDLNNNNNINEPIILFGNSEFLMEVNEDIEISKIIEMYYRHYEEIPIPRKDSLLLGSYWKSISYLWGYDVKKEFEKEPIYDFSIIIPVRNSIKYLRETIETCLDQDYNGTYEILISDNSCGKIDVLNFIKSFNNNKIRYIRTPYDLSLTKSFEFAYLNARGKYLISLGSDDGMIQTGISVVNNAIKQFSQNNVIMWPCAFYRWPKWHGEDRNRLFFEKRVSDPIGIFEIDAKPLIRDCLVSDLYTTGIPALYLVTCIKREHIRKIIEFTGKFEDGMSQDGYTGILNLFLEDKITYVEYPVVIAGNSEVGVGAIAEQKVNNLEIYKRQFLKRYSNQRYFNYYNRKFLNIKVILSLGTKNLLYREYLIVDRYGIKKILLKQSDCLKILYDMYNWLLIKNPADYSLYLCALDSIALTMGDKVYQDYLNNRVKWMIMLKLKNFIVKITKNTILYYKLKKLFNKLVENHFCNKSQGNIESSKKNKIYQPIIDINLYIFGDLGIKYAAVYLYNALSNGNSKN